MYYLAVDINHNPSDPMIFSCSYFNKTDQQRIFRILIDLFIIILK